MWDEMQQLLKCIKVSSISLLDPGVIDVFESKILLFKL